MLLRLVGAYGRQYTSKEALIKDWNDGKDFRIVNGPYCSIRDLPEIRKRGFTQIELFGIKNPPGSITQVFVPVEE